MGKLTLVIGNKNYSSWSLRAWLALKQTDEPFEEIRLPLHTPEFEKEIVKYSPSGKVPCLIDGDTVVRNGFAQLKRKLKFSIIDFGLKLFLFG